MFVIMSAAVTAEPTLESGGERDDWMTRQLATEFAVGSNLPLTWGACHCISSRVCPESGQVFPVEDGIPNMTLGEDQVAMHLGAK